jgi:hypothetical protein
MTKTTAPENRKNTFPVPVSGCCLSEGWTTRKVPVARWPEARKRALEAEIRDKYAGFSRADFLNLETLSAYRNDDKRFNPHIS